MNLKVVSITENAVQVQIEKEDYSIADIIHRELLNVKHVKFAGVPPPHPLIKTLTIQVHTDGAQPAKVIKEAVELSQARIGELLSVAKETFPRAQREQAPTAGSTPAGDLGPSESTSVGVVSNPVESQTPQPEVSPSSV